jgi:hypothetical protein
MSANAIQLERFEAKLKDRTRRLPSVSLPPPLDSNPKPQLGLLVLTVNIAETDAADQPVARNEANGKVRRTVVAGRIVLLLDPGQRVIHTVGVRNRQGGVGDLSRAGEPLQLGGIAEAEASEKEAISAQAGSGTHTPSVGVLLRSLDARAQLRCGFAQADQLGVTPTHRTGPEITSETAAHLGGAPDPEALLKALVPSGCSKKSPQPETHVVQRAFKVFQILHGGTSECQADLDGA